jgi:hypothetical protein
VGIHPHQHGQTLHTPTNTKNKKLSDVVKSTFSKRGKVIKIKALDNCNIIIIIVVVVVDTTTTKKYIIKQATI